MSVCLECCVLSGRGLCDELITCPEESYRMWCAVVCDLETSWMRRPQPTGGCCIKNKLGGTCNHFFAGVNKLKFSASYCVTPKATPYPPCILEYQGRREKSIRVKEAQYNVMFCNSISTVISGFNRNLNEIFALLGRYAVSYRRFGTTYRVHCSSSRTV